jgi:phosphoserine aminotransferase
MNTFFTVGPAQIHPAYEAIYMEALRNNVGSISHRSAAFRAIYKHTDQELKQLLNIPQDYAIFFAGSATEIWERIILNTVKEHSFHFVNGDFAKKFYDFAKKLGRKPQAQIVDNGATFDFDKVTIPADVELICTTQNETSNGTALSKQQLATLKQRYPNALLCTDIVSSVPLQDVDFTNIDMAFFSVQKAMAMPAGLGVWIVAPSVLQRFKQLQHDNVQVGAHHTLDAYFKNYENWETPSTPNVMAIYCLGKIAALYNQIGVQQLREQALAKKAYLKSELKNIAYLSPFLQGSNESLTVLVYNTTSSVSHIVDQLKEQGIIIGKGYGSLKDSQIRIANFPALNMNDCERLVAALKACS